MELICPDCRADLVIADAQNATCAAHDGRYQILFDRSSADLPAGTIAGAPPAAATSAPQFACVQHPGVQAVARCRVCSNGMCATCDFVLPGNVHVCPACLEKEPSTEITPKRRRLMVIAFLIAAFSTMMFVMLMSGTLHRAFGNTEAGNEVLGSIILWSAVAGVAASLASIDRRLRNPVGIWVALVWNAVNLGIFILLMIIGLSRG